MAYDEELADRLRELLAGQPVEETKMFGGLAFLLAGNMCVAASGKGGLMVRVDPADLPSLITEPGAEPFEMRGRPMKGWLRVSTHALDDDASLAVWVRRAVDYARTLPSK